MQTADQVTSSLVAWLRGCFVDAQVSLAGAPVEEGGGPVVQVALADIQLESAHNRLTPATILRLGYFITVSASDILQIHRYLGEIVFALAENPLLAIPDAEPVHLRLEHRAEGPLGVAVSTAIARARPRVAAPPVLFPPAIRVEEMGVVEGMVEDAEGVAVAGAVVELPSLQLRQVTGPDGRFRFHARAGSPDKLRVTARKHRFSKTATAEIGQRLTLRLAQEN